VPLYPKFFLKCAIIRVAINSKDTKMQEETKEKEEIQEQENPETTKEKMVTIEENNQTLKDENIENNEESSSNEQSAKSQELQESDLPQEEANIVPATPTKKSDDLKSKVDQIKQNAQSIYNNYNSYVQKFEDSSADLANQENEIIKSTISKTTALFKELGIDNLSSINTRLSEIKLDNKEELLEVKEPSKGRGKGFFYGLIASVASLAGAALYGAKLSNLPLVASTFMQKSNLDTIASNYLKLANLDKPPLYGYIGIGAGALLIGFIVYKLTTFMQKLKNVKYVNSLEENSKEYSSKLQLKIEDIKELLEQLDKIKLVNKKYDVILQEQNAKINRMLFIEQPKEINDLHKTSKLEVEKTMLILDELIKLMDTPVSKDDVLNPSSVTNLNSANSVINEVIKKLY
jgi:hypothetical protein